MGTMGLAFTVIGSWTVLSFAVALVLGRASRPLQPIPVRTTEVVDLRRIR